MGHRSARSGSGRRGSSPFAPPPLPKQKSGARPKLELISNPPHPTDGGLPFAPASAPMGMRRVPAKEITSVYRGKRRGASNVHANILGVPLPPATEEAAERRFKARESKSVIADVMRSRAGLGRVHGLSRQASHAMRDVLAGGFEVASYLGEGSLRAVRRFEAMPRRRQILWVATPYAVVLLLVGLLLHVRSPERASATVIAPAAPIKESPKLVEETKKAEVPPPEKSVIPQNVEIAEKPDKIVGTWREVQAMTYLRTMPDSKAAKVAKLEENSKVIVYSGIDAKLGWLVAQRPGAEIGFMKASVLEPHPEKESVKKLALKKTTSAKKKRREG